MPADSTTPRLVPRWALLAALGWLAAYAAGLVLVHDPAAVTAQSDLVYAVPDLLSTGIAAWAARRWWRAGQRRAAAGWACLTAACACSLAADAVYAGYYYVAGRDEVFPSWADALWLLSYVAVIPAVVLSFARVSPLRQLRAGLDALVALLGLGAVLWTVVLAPQLTDGWTLGAALAIAYPLLDLAVLVTLLSVGVSGHRRTGLPVVLLGAGALLLTATDLVSAYASDLHSYLDGSWCDWGWQSAGVVICLAALAAGRSAPADGAASGLVDHAPLSGARSAPAAGPPGDALLVDREALSLVPLLVGVGAVLALVGVQAVQGGASGPGLALAAGAVLTVVLRLLLSIADQRSVSRSLDVALAEQQRLAITDMLTELYNRRFIEELLGLEAARGGAGRRRAGDPARRHRPLQARQRHARPPGR